MTNDERMTKSEVRTQIGRRRHLCHSTFGILSAFVISHSSLVLSGCVTKAKAREQAQAAFLAGQQQAMQRMQQQQLQQTTRGAVVSFVGPITNPNIPWTSDLTLSQAIVQAGYTGGGD